MYERLSRHSENELLRKQLLFLGYEVPNTKFSYSPPNERNKDELVSSPNKQLPASRSGINSRNDIRLIEKFDEYRDRRREPGNQVASTHTTPRPQSNQAHLAEHLVFNDDSGSSGTKRKRADYLRDAQGSWIEAENVAKGTSRDMMPPPSALPIRSPPRLSHRSNDLHTSPRLPVFRKQNNAEQTTERRDPKVVQANRYDRLQHKVNVIPPEPTGGDNNDHPTQSLERIYETGTGHMTSPGDYKRARLQDPGNKALLGDPSFVPPKLIQGPEPSLAHHSSNVIPGSRDYNYEKSSQYSQSHRVQSPKRIDALFGMEDVIRNIYRPSPEEGPFQPRSTHGTDPLAHHTGSNANRRQVVHLNDIPTDEPLDPSKLPRRTQEPYPFRWWSPYRNHIAAPVTPAPLRQRYDSTASPYKLVSSPFFHSPRAKLIAGTRPVARSKNEEFRDMLQGFRMEPAQPSRTSVRSQTYTNDPYGVYQDPFYRGRESITAAYNSLIVPETPRTAEGLFRRPDLVRSVPSQSMQTTRDKMYETWAESSAPKRAAPLPSATPLTSGLLGPQSSFGSRRQDMFGIRGARSGTSRMQSFGNPSNSRPATYGQKSHWHDSDDRVGSSTVNVMRGIRR
ncbi:MAG: hypothetical protein Q9165_008189 [Trypethelium subeluteriae]